MSGLLTMLLLIVAGWLAWPTCPHQNQTLPITLAGKTYRVCLDCTRQIPFRAYR